jgi:hypothetical protein
VSFCRICLPGRISQILPVASRALRRGKPSPSGILRWEVPSSSGYRPPRRVPPITESPRQRASPQPTPITLCQLLQPIPMPMPMPIGVDMDPHANARPMPPCPHAHPYPWHTHPSIQAHACIAISHSRGWPDSRGGGHRGAAAAARGSSQGKEGNPAILRPQSITRSQLGIAASHLPSAQPVRPASHPSHPSPPSHQLPACPALPACLPACPCSSPSSSSSSSLDRLIPIQRWPPSTLTSRPPPPPRWRNIPATACPSRCTTRRASSRYVISPVTLPSSILRLHPCLQSLPVSLPIQSLPGCPPSSSPCLRQMPLEMPCPLFRVWSAFWFRPFPLVLNLE